MGALLEYLGADAVPCSEVFAPGRPTDSVLADNDRAPCVDAAGEVQLVLSGLWDCDDGLRAVASNDWGYGLTGGTWHPPASDWTMELIAETCGDAVP